MAIYYVDMPCKPVVKQYLQNRYGNPIQFPRNDWYRSILLRMLARPNKHYDSTIGLQHYTTAIRLPILYSEFENFGNTLTKTGIMHLNQIVQDVVEEALYNYIELYYVVAKMPLNNTIYNFRVQYGFPEESYSTAAIHKFWQRETKRRKKYKKIAPQTVLNPIFETPKIHISAKT